MRGLALCAAAALLLAGCASPEGGQAAGGPGGGWLAPGRLFAVEPGAAGPVAEPAIGRAEAVQCAAAAMAAFALVEQAGGAPPLLDALRLKAYRTVDRAVEGFGATRADMEPVSAAMILAGTAADTYLFCSERGLLAPLF